MVESGRMFSQTEYDASLGVPEELRGELSQEAQLARHACLVADGVPDEVARQQLGLTNEDFITSKLQED